MLPIVSLLPRFLRSEGAAVLGDCIVCSEAVRERDDRMRLSGRYVHTACAGYRMRNLARSRVVGSQPARAQFTGD